MSPISATPCSSENWCSSRHCPSAIHCTKQKNFSRCEKGLRTSGDCSPSQIFAAFGSRCSSCHSSHFSFSPFNSISTRKNEYGCNQLDSRSQNCSKFL